MIKNLIGNWHMSFYTIIIGGILCTKLVHLANSLLSTFQPKYHIISKCHVLFCVLSKFPLSSSPLLPNKLCGFDPSSPFQNLHFHIWPRVTFLTWPWPFMSHWNILGHIHYMDSLVDPIWLFLWISYSSPVSCLISSLWFAHVYDSHYSCMTA